MLVGHAATAAAATTALLEGPLERLDLHHEQIGLHGLRAILGNGVIGHQIAGHEPLRWRHLAAFICLMGAVGFVFLGK